MSQQSFTVTQQRILDVLADGQKHTKEELHACLGDEMSDVTHNVGTHVYNIRAKLKGTGQDIVCVYHMRRYYYQHVRLLASSYTGYK